MQISSNLLYDRSAARMGALMATATKLQTQIATGKKINSPSENVAVAQQLAEFDRKDADAGAFKTNLDLAGSLLKQADGTMGSITEQMQRATELVNNAATDTLGASDRKVIGDQLQSVIATLVSLGNTNDLRGQPLFGSAAGTPAVIDNKDGTFTFPPDVEVSEVPIADGQTVQATESAKRIFTLPGGTDNTLEMLSKLAATLNAGGDVSASVATSLDQINQAVDQVADVSASVGARGARVDLQQQLLTSANTDRSELRGKIEQVDVTDAVVQLQQMMTALSASQASFSKLSSLSLFDYLK